MILPCPSPMTPEKYEKYYRGAFEESLLRDHGVSDDSCLVKTSSVGGMLVSL